MIGLRRLHLTDMTPAPHLPWARPTFPVFSYLVLHPAGPILIDTGVGTGNPMIEELYTPVHHHLDEALDRHGVKIDIAIVITSHLHFDHCGQNHRFAASRIIVQQAEVEAAKAPLYTVPEWAFPSMLNLTVIDGDHEVASGVRIIATPGRIHQATNRYSSRTATGPEPSSAAKRPGTSRASLKRLWEMTAGTKTPVQRR